MNITRGIVEYGKTALVRWPILGIEGAAIHYITGMTLFSIAKYFPTVFATALILLMSIFIRKVFEDRKVAFFVILLMVTLQVYIPRFNLPL